MFYRLCIFLCVVCLFCACYDNRVDSASETLSEQGAGKYSQKNTTLDSEKNTQDPTPPSFFVPRCIAERFLISEFYLEEDDGNMLQKSSVMNFINSTIMNSKCFKYSDDGLKVKIKYKFTIDNKNIKAQNDIDDVEKITMKLHVQVELDGKKINVIKNNTNDIEIFYNLTNPPKKSRNQILIEHIDYLLASNFSELIRSLDSNVNDFGYLWY